MKYYKFDVRARNGSKGCYEIYREYDDFIQNRMPQELLDLVCLAKNVDLHNGKHIVFGLWESFIKSDDCPPWVKNANPKQITLIWTQV